MEHQFFRYIAGFVDAMLKENGSRENTIFAIRHYNTFAITSADAMEIASRYPGYRFVYHCYSGEEMTDAVAPFLKLIQDFSREYYAGNIDAFLEECQVYNLQRSVFASYIKNSVCSRQEELLLTETAYEQEEIQKSIIKIIKKISEKQPVVLILNHLHLAGYGTISLLNAILDADIKDMGILSVYNNLHRVLPHISTLWDTFTEKLEERNLVVDGEGMKSRKYSAENGVFHFDQKQIKTYLLRLTNMFHLLDLEQARYYLNIIYNKIEREKLCLSDEAKYSFFELFVRVSLLLDDIPAARLVCGRIQELLGNKKNPDREFSYFHLLGFVQMYSGNLKEAIRCAKQCRKLARGKAVFQAELLEVMAKMSGWHNIMFCAHDVPVAETFLQQAEELHYTNHLAYIYIFAYDNDPELFQHIQEGGKIAEEKLRFFEKGIALAKQLGNKCLLIKAYRKNVMIASVNGLFEVSDYFYYKWENIVSKKDPFAAANIYNGLGYNSCATEQYEKANEYYCKALRLFYRENQIDYVGETLYNMAVNCMLAQEYKRAYHYLTICLKIVETQRLNNLRICNISKLFGLLALCSYRLRIVYNCNLYLNRARQFLSHILEQEKEKEGEVNIDPSFLLCDDDIFLYYYVKGLLGMEEGEYEKAQEYFHAAGPCVERSHGFRFFSFVQYHLAIAQLYKRLGRDDAAKRELECAAAYAKNHENPIQASIIQAQLNGSRTEEISYQVGIQLVTLEEITAAVKQAGIQKDFEEKKRQFDFLTVWQKITDTGETNKNTMICNAMNAFRNHSNMDGIIFIRIQGGKPSIQYENTPIPLKEDMVYTLEAYFQKHRAGFVTSKLQPNYNEFHKVIALFGANKVCSMIGIPFYVNEQLDSIFITYILMKENWNSQINKYMLDDSDYSLCSLIFQQLLDALERLENQKKIQEINARLEKSAITDFLTGLYNRDGFYRNIGNLLELSGQETAGEEKQGIGLSILYIDLDNFKYYNDTFGHDAGDLILKEIARILKKAAGNLGFVSRFGGDEFLVVLLDTEEKQAVEAAQQILDEIRKKNAFIEEIGEFLGRKVEIPEEKKVTCSIGIAIKEEIKDKQMTAEAVKAADDMLYSIKRSTKNNYGITKG